MAEAKKGSEAAAGTSRNGDSMRVDSALVRELALLLTSNDLHEIEVEDGDRKIKVRRDPAPVYSASPASHSYAPSQAPQPAQAAPAAADSGVTEAAADDAKAIKAPMVGTAYLSAEPGGKPFVTSGATVKAGDTLLIVEAMKVMNPITAPAAGTVRKVLVTDGQPVEFDQPLIVLD